MKLLLSSVAISMALAGPAIAASPFDGTWKGDVKSAQLSKKPDVILLKDGVYTCSSCNPVFTVAADGVFHPVTGMPYVDEASVTVVDARTVTETDKFKGKVVNTTKTVVSPDGKSVAINWVDTSAPDGKPTSGDVKQMRVGAAPAGSHATSGMWRTAAVANISDSALTETFATTGDSLSMMTPNGYSYTAKFGGPPVPLAGDNANTMIAVRKINATTVEETDTRNGEVVSVYTMTALPGGKTIKVVNENRKQGRTSIYTMLKQ